VPERLNLTPGMAKDLTRFLEEKLPGRHVIVIPGGGHLEAVPRPSQLDRIEAMLKQLLGAA
jgi:hypothetical protein